MKKVIYGINPVIEALSAKNLRITEIIIQAGKDNKRVGQILKSARNKFIPVRYEDKKELNKFGGSHQGVVAVLSDFAYSKLDELLLEIKDKKDAKLLLIDCILDPHNLGALIRSACAFSFDGVIIQDKRSAPVTASVIKAASGAIFHIPVCLVKNLSNALQSVKDNGFWSVGMTIDADKYISELDLRTKTALIIGNEEKGMRSLVAKNCDFLAKIPISKKVNSLNASAAGACAMYEIIRQQNAGEM